MTRNTSQKGGKRAIIRDVMAAGFPARTSAKAVNAVFDFMKEALRYHEDVQMPGLGTLRAVIQRGRPRRRLQRTRNITTKQVEFHDVVLPGRRRVIKLTPDPDLKLPLSPTPPLPVKPKAALDGAPVSRRMPTVVAHVYRGGAEPSHQRWSRTGYRR